MKWSGGEALEILFQSFVYNLQHEFPIFGVKFSAIANF